MSTKINITPGNVIKFGDIEFIVLDLIGDEMLVIAKDSVYAAEFDIDRTNNFRDSTIRTYLNSSFLDRLADNGADVSMIMEHAIELTSDDGLKDYGMSVQKVFLLTTEMYRKYRSLIPRINHWWWTSTPYSTEANGYRSTVCYVHVDGAIDKQMADDEDCAIRPAFYLKASVLKSVAPTVSLAEFSTEELLKEVMRRNAETD